MSLPGSGSPGLLSAGRAVKLLRAHMQEQLSAAQQLVSGKENLSMADTKKSRSTVRAKVLAPLH